MPKDTKGTRPAEPALAVADWEVRLYGDGGLHVIKRAVLRSNATQHVLSHPEDGGTLFIADRQAVAYVRRIEDRSEEGTG